MKWPWSKRETGYTKDDLLRERRAGYTDAVIERIIERAGGEAGAAASDTGAGEFAAKMYSAAFAMAETSVAVLTPPVLSAMARDQVTEGESLWAIDVGAEGLELLRAADWQVTGGPQPESWRYWMRLPAPSRPDARNALWDGVVHLLYSNDPETPWKGVSPFARASLTSKLGATVELRSSQEAAAPSGYALPVPAQNEPDPEAEDQTDPLTKLASDIRGAKGGIRLVETTADAWGQGRAGAPMLDWRQQRFGYEPPAGMVELRRDASTAIVSAAGIPAPLWIGGDGATIREAWRSFLHGAVAPMARQMETELSRKLETEVRLNFDSLFASDIQGRARAFQSLVGGGMEPAQAAVIAGVA